jgi:hypothetical protein
VSTTFSSLCTDPRQGFKTVSKAWHKTITQAGCSGRVQGNRIK